MEILIIIIATFNPQSIPPINFSVFSQITENLATSSTQNPNNLPLPLLFPSIVGSVISELLEFWIGQLTQ